MGSFETLLVGRVELTVRYHSGEARILTLTPNRGGRQFQVGSLTGAVASSKLTEARKGSLGPVGNGTIECKSRRELDCETHKSNRDESRL